MVFKKNLDNGGKTGFQVPFVPRARRSARRRSPCKKKMDNNQMSSLKLLASVALLQERNSSSVSSNTTDDNNNNNNKKNLIAGKSKDGGKRPPFQKKKVCINHESVRNSTRKENGHENVMPSLVLSHQNEVQAKDSHVKFGIKSIQIPMLRIEVPQTTSVGSLKRVVVDAVTALLGGGLSVGVVLGGKKIQDDSKTLSQSGISGKDTIDTLDFVLEPSSMLAGEDAPLQSPCDGLQLVTRYPTNFLSVIKPRDHVSTCGRPVELTIEPSCSDPENLAFAPVISKSLPELPPPPMNLGKSGEGSFLVSNVLSEQTVPESRALVLVPPVGPRGRCTDMAQRRTRRPFSISEVEALIQAVEELGTGKWRDVKLHAFATAGHRTYLDLKDKWKSLVHTASIPLHLRRGKLVPQELLDRVLSVQARRGRRGGKTIGKRGRPKAVCSLPN